MQRKAARNITGAFQQTLFARLCKRGWLGTAHMSKKPSTVFDSLDLGRTATYLVSLLGWPENKSTGTKDGAFSRAERKATLM